MFLLFPTYCKTPLAFAGGVFAYSYQNYTFTSILLFPAKRNSSGNYIYAESASGYNRNFNLRNKCIHSIRCPIVFNRPYIHLLTKLDIE